MTMVYHVGDHVRVIGWPPEFHRERLHPETVTFYERIIKERIVLEVSRIDHFGIAYADVMIVCGGEEQWHSIALNHSAVETVPRRIGE